MSWSLIPRGLVPCGEFCKIKNKKFHSSSSGLGTRREAHVLVTFEMKCTEIARSFTEWLELKTT